MAFLVVVTGALAVALFHRASPNIESLARLLPETPDSASFAAEPAADDAAFAAEPAADDAAYTLPQDDHEVTKDFGLVDRQQVPAAELLHSRWGIEIYLPKQGQWSTPGGTRGGLPDPEAINEFGLRFVAALSRYPDTYVARTGLRRLMVLRDFHHKGTRVGMIAMSPYGTIAGDVISGETPRAIHHEVFHLADYRMFGASGKDASWLALNTPGFSYLGSGRSMTAAHAGRYDEIQRLTDEQPGFVTGYSLADALEDRAELFSAMITEPAYVERRCQTDAILGEKTRYLEAALARWEPGMDAEFWAGLKNGN